MAAALLFAAGAATAQWNFENAETLQFGSGLNGQNLVVDDEGTLYAVFRSGSILNHYYRTTNSEQWSTPEQVNDSASWSPSGDFAVAWNPLTRHPVVAYTAGDRVWLAERHDGGTWTRSALSDPLEDAMSPDVAVNDSGEIFVVYILLTGGAYQLEYAFYDGAEWEWDVIAEANLGAFGSGARPRAGVQANGIAHVAFRAIGDQGYKVQHATNSEPGGNSWVLTDLVVPHAESYPGDLIVTPDGTAYCVTEGSEGFGIPAPVYFHRRTPGGGWLFGVAASDRPAGDPVVALDSQFDGHTMWLPVSGNFYSGEIFYSSENNFWTPVLIHDNVGTGACFVIDPENFGHLIVETGQGVLKYLKSETSLLHVAGDPELTITPAAIDFDSLEVGEDSTVHVSLMNSGDDILTVWAFEVYGTGFSGPPQWWAISLSPGASISGPINFAPTNPDDFEGFALIWSTAASSPDTIPLSGVGYVVSSGGDAPAPLEFALHPLFPNPFNGLVNVSFELPHASDVSLRVYDVLGREAGVVLNGSLQAGTHAAQWSCAECASGIYLFKLEAAGQTIVQKAVYQK
ncbi:MAG: T9SS type A sorting domain-containing protein [Calditrichaeota bacterium]|nr:T9SS type A sorting domain-containing protein [Calditrichota bacterium]